MNTTTENNLAQLAANVARLEKELIVARLELSAATPCPLCDKTEAQGCKGYTNPYTCDGKVRQ